MEVDTSPSKADQQHLEVTGVSRSGRVRKKSSKLMDFQSLDDVEPKSKKTKGRGRPKGQRVKRDSERHSDDDDDEDFVGSGGDGDGERDGEGDSDSEFEVDDEHDLDLEEGEDEEVAGVDPTVRQSLYMSEKSNKKKILKDGKLVFGKPERKDKGKSRFTAYMLWAKDVRRQLVANQPDMDFATLSRRISEMWANVPQNERVIWRRKAKRLATSTKKKILKDSMQTAAPTSKPTSTFINRATTSRTKKNAELAAMSPTKGTPRKEPLASPGQQTSPSTQPGSYKVTGIEPMDVAAHLRLLGESLTLIGDRLMEHEGQITVSGSLSVLMDSLLCSLCPLLCLTTQLPGLEQRKELRDNLHKTLDNIAYVMPGL